MGLKNQFGKKLQELRLVRGLTQEQLAEKADLSVGTITKIENGLRYPKAETLEMLKNVLMVSYIDFYDFESDNHINFDSKLLFELSLLNEKGKKILYDFSNKVLKDYKEFIK